jgi:hypothetical protein
MMQTSLIPNSAETVSFGDDTRGQTNGSEVQNPGCQVACVTEFCTVAPNVCGSSVWNLLHVTFL